MNPPEFQEDGDGGSLVINRVGGLEGSVFDEGVEVEERGHDRSSNPRFKKERRSLYLSPSESELVCLF